jgi:hypothetical protein
MLPNRHTESHSKSGTGRLWRIILPARPWDGGLTDVVPPANITDRQLPEARD